MELFENIAKKPKIILLDYQATLVENFGERQQWMAIPGNMKKPYTEWIKLEKMRMKLVEMLKGYHVILITARSTKYQTHTLAHIKANCDGWFPDEWYFNEWEIDAPLCKRNILREYIFPKHGEVRDKFFAVESNAHTRSMYRKLGIKALRFDDEWTEIPMT